MRYFRFEKLVRDEVVYEMMKSGSIPKYRYLEDDEYLERLIQKLGEEVDEVKMSKKKDMIFAEVVDLQDVLDSILLYLEKSKKDLRHAQRIKKKENGVFEKRIFVEYVKCNKDSDWVEYYLKNKEKYPEIVMETNSNSVCYC